jgi:hypothetical protein
MVFGSSKHICTPKLNICNLWFILVEQTWIRNKIKTKKLEFVSSVVFHSYLCFVLDFYEPNQQN